MTDEIFFFDLLLISPRVTGHDCRYYQYWWSVISVQMFMWPCSVIWQINAISGDIWCTELSDIFPKIYESTHLEWQGMAADYLI